MEGAAVSIDSGPSVLPDAIHAELRARIINQGFAPGSSITESAVALQFGVARPTAKMAIERLVAEGLLRRELHQSARVPQLDRDDILDLFDNRAVIESAAVGALADSGIVPLSAVRAHRALVESANHDEPFAEHDIDFHRALVSGQPSVRLARMHGLLMGEIELCIGQVQAGQLIDARDVAAQHQEILDAVIASDRSLAVARTREHILSSRDALLEHHDARSGK
jgi:DNA-binding GntR family transcriptional regulator